MAAASPARQAMDLGSDFIDQLLRVAGQSHCLAAAGRPGDDREIAARKVPSAGQQLKERLADARRSLEASHCHQWGEDRRSAS